MIIKTFVTTDLQKAIAEHYGLRCVETLTGFKYIGAKLGKYERETIAALGADRSEKHPYHQMSEEETRRLRLAHSSFYVFGGEESYGYSGADFVRDKDGNGAALMFCEVAAYAKSLGLTLDALLDELFCTFGYFQEKTGAMTFEARRQRPAVHQTPFPLHPNLHRHLRVGPVDQAGVSPQDEQLVTLNRHLSPPSTGCR